jgi:hypothetical protein
MIGSWIALFVVVGVVAAIIRVCAERAPVTTALVTAAIVTAAVIDKLKDPHE